MAGSPGSAVLAGSFTSCVQPWEPLRSASNSPHGGPSSRPSAAAHFGGRAPTCGSADQAWALGSPRDRPRFLQASWTRIRSLRAQTQCFGAGLLRPALAARPNQVICLRHLKFVLHRLQFTYNHSNARQAAPRPDLATRAPRLRAVTRPSLQSPRAGQIDMGACMSSAQASEKGSCSAERAKTPHALRADPGPPPLPHPRHRCTATAHPAVAADAPGRRLEPSPPARPGRREPQGPLPTCPTLMAQANAPASRMTPLFAAAARIAATATAAAPPAMAVMASSRPARRSGAAATRAARRIWRRCAMPGMPALLPAWTASPAAALGVACSVPLAQPLGCGARSTRIQRYG